MNPIKHDLNIALSSAITQGSRYKRPRRKERANGIGKGGGQALCTRRERQRHKREGEKRKRISDPIRSTDWRRRRRQRGPLTSLPSQRTMSRIDHAGTERFQDRGAAPVTQIRGQDPGHAAPHVRPN
ncbi:hypothetical protein MRX96_042846 [Rhipicephalus microplus]